jgi:hypothetical protein
VTSEKHVTQPSPPDQGRRAAPAAAAAVAIVAGLVGVSLLSDGDRSSAETAPPGAVSTPERREAAAERGFPEAGMPELAPQLVPDLGDQPRLAGPAFDRLQAPPRIGVEVVVKFRDDAEAQAIAKQFWRDAEGARKRFAEFAAGRAELKGLELDRATYSDELVLKPAQPMDLPGMRAVAKAISAAPGVAYAEPNATAQPGDKK